MVVEHKLVDGVEIELSAEEIAQRKAEEDAWKAGAFDRAIAGLRSKRNSLIASSDWTVLSDSPLSAELKTAWKTYRQALRDITENLTTVAQVNAVVFPDKP
jgi:ABC-type amino acid transport substrate-binding protein